MLTEVQRLEWRIKAHKWVTLITGFPAALIIIGRAISGDQDPNAWGVVLSGIAILSAAGIIGLRVKISEARQRLLDEALTDPN